MGEPTIEEIREAREQIPETDGVDSEAMVIFANMYTPDAFPVCQVTDESFLKFYHRAPDYIDFLLTELKQRDEELERLKAEKDAANGLAEHAMGQFVRVKDVLSDVAIPSLRYCEQKFDYDNQARLNCEAALDISGKVDLSSP